MASDDSPASSQTPHGLYAYPTKSSALNCDVMRVTRSCSSLYLANSASTRSGNVKRPCLYTRLREPAHTR